MRQADKQMKFINILLIALDNDRQQTFEDKRNGPGFGHCVCICMQIAKLMSPQTKNLSKYGQNKFINRERSFFVNIQINS